MSTPVACTDCFNTGGITKGFGGDSKRLVVIYGETIKRLKASETLGGALSYAIDSLIEIYNDCKRPDWDGYGALPISVDAFAEAREFLYILPANIPMPEIVPEPSGDIGMEWSAGKRRTFILSLSGEKEIIYAGLFGLNRIRGRENFSHSIPHNIFENIRRTYS